MPLYPPIVQPPSFFALQCHVLILGHFGYSLAHLGGREGGGPKGHGGGGLRGGGRGCHKAMESADFHLPLGAVGCACIT